MFLHAYAAGTVARHKGGALVGKKDPVLDIVSVGDMPQGGRAIQTAIDLQLFVPAQSSLVLG